MTRCFLSSQIALLSELFVASTHCNFSCCHNLPQCGLSDSEQNLFLYLGKDSDNMIAMSTKHSSCCFCSSRCCFFKLLMVYCLIILILILVMFRSLINLRYWSSLQAMVCPNPTQQTVVCFLATTHDIKPWLLVGSRPLTVVWCYG